MPDLSNTISDPYQFLEKLSTEELKRLLRADLESEEEGGAANDEFITRVMEVVAQREKDASPASVFDTAAGWESFQKNYYPTGKSPILLCDEKTLQALSRGNRVEKERQPSHGAGVKTPVRWVKRVALLAAAITVFMGLLIAAQAAGLDVFGAMARWTDETFHFAAAPVSDEVLALRSALEARDIPVEYAPTWVPAGFQADAPQVSVSKKVTEVSAHFSNGEQEFCVIITQCTFGNYIDFASYEKNLDNAIPYQNGRQLFYIFENSENTVATWSDGESSIIEVFGTISTDDIKSIIDSIGG